MKVRDILWGVGLVLVLLVGVNFPVGGGKTIVERTIEKAGSIPGDSLNSSCFTINGFQSCYAQQGFYTATNTVCSFKSPSATSTLAKFQASFKTSSTSASQIIFGKGTFQAATTTALGGLFPIAANGQIAVVASTTNYTDANQTVFQLAPNTWVNLNMVPSGSGVGTESPTGGCTARFDVI